jgi:hypothetical protein
MTQMAMNEGKREPSYLVRLFSLQYNWIPFGGALLFALASASPEPALVGVVAELAVLLVGSNLPPVRRWLDRRDAGLRRSAANHMVAVRGLERELASRVLAVDQALDEIREFGGPRPEPEFERAVTRLRTLLDVHLGLCETHQRVSAFLSAISRQELVAEAERLKAAFVAEKDIGLRLTLRQALTLAQRRIDHRESLVQTLRGVGVRLESLERSVAYLRSQGEALASSARFASEVETLVRQIDPPAAVELELPEIGRLTPHPPAASFG